jgi:hypothetical protein
VNLVAISGWLAGLKAISILKMQDGEMKNE